MLSWPCLMRLRKRGLGDMALDRWPEIVVAGVVVGAVAAILAVVAAVSLWRARVAEERRFAAWAATRSQR
jgi:hypothetical protein